MKTELWVTLGVVLLAGCKAPMPATDMVPDYGPRPYQHAHARSLGNDVPTRQACGQRPAAPTPLYWALPELQAAQLNAEPATSRDS